MNYNSFFGFSESPFLDVPDQRFLFVSRQHEQLWSELAEFINARRGVALLSGEDGVGKTMLVQALVTRLPQSFHPVEIIRPAAEPLAITVMFAQTLGITLRDRNLVNLTPLTEAVRTAAQQEKFFVMILDDAQALTDQHLEEIYVLSQIEHQGRQLIPIMLVGRKGLMQKVASKANQRLHELIRANLSLGGLSFEETPLYIDHRLQQVGSSFTACFAEGCSGQLFSRTGGIPRGINQVCDQALTRAWQQNRPQVTRDLLGGEEPSAPYKPLAPPSKWAGLKGYGGLTVGLLLISLASFAIYSHFYRPDLRPLPPVAVTASPPSTPPPAAPQATSPPAPLPLPQAQPPDQAVETTAGQQEESPTPALEPLQVAEDSQELIVADISQQLPLTEEQAPEPESLRLATYHVAPEDGLLKIVSTHYPDDKDTGYNAIILANPQITNEDVIYQGQNLLLPKVDKDTKVISINNKQHFGIIRQYYNATQLEKTVATLKDLQIKIFIRETFLLDDIKVYRVFVGDYESLAEVRKAMALAEKSL